jgi:hypothetical protein
LIRSLLRGAKVSCELLEGKQTHSKNNDELSIP